MFALGFAAAGLVLGRRLKELGKPVDWAYEVVFAALVGGVVGAKVYFVIQHGDLGSLFTGTGLVWYGGALGGAAAVIGWSAWRKMLNVQLLDICCVPLALGYAVGRIGCQLSGDGDYGIPWGGPWAMSYPHGTVPTDPDRPPDADLRDHLVGPDRLVAVAQPRPVPPRDPVRLVPGPLRARALPDRVHPPQQRGRSRPHRAAAREPGPDRGRRGLDPGRAAAPRRDPSERGQSARHGVGLNRIQCVVRRWDGNR